MKQLNKTIIPPLVNLNVNPCKMCMPMGAVSALYGVRGCMSILHGSQGCATYIRRHMATHYNEPVDIASSSLTEQGTVFGGEKNLIKGLENLIKLYSPEVIGIATTCLAETIGEDVNSHVSKFFALHPEYSHIKIVCVSSAGFGGTQYDGFFRALRSLTEQAEHNTTPNNKVNIVTPMLSPADTRWLKSFFDTCGLDYILLPDLSENLDGVSVEKYERLKTGGTSFADIGSMSGARFTIEFSDFVSDENSPAKYLYDEFGVDYKRLPLPTGIRAMDMLYDTVRELGGTINAEQEKERGRYIDAITDCHKYCAAGRAAIFGEPDFVGGVVRLCCEVGVVPMLAVTGGVCADFAERLLPEIKAAAELAFADAPVISDDRDFAFIEKYCAELAVNMMIGSSDGRRISHKYDIPLIRCAFPIHDRMGGQRVRTVGYEGSLFLLDSMANIILGGKEKNFRREIKGRFFEENREES